MITQEQFEIVCSLIECTTNGISFICKEIGVSTSDFYAFMNSSDANSKHYARAKTLQVEPLLNQIRILQNDCITEIRTMEDSRKCNAIQSSYREQIRHIEWVISKLLPKKYGDKIDITSDGEKLPAPPSTLTIQIAQEKTNATD